MYLRKINNRILTIIFLILALTVLLFFLFIWGVPLGSYAYSNQPQELKQENVSKINLLKPIEKVITGDDIFGDEKQLSEIEEKSMLENGLKSKDTIEASNSIEDAKIGQESETVEISATISSAESSVTTDPSKISGEKKVDEISPDHSLKSEDQKGHYSYCQAKTPDKAFYAPLKNKELLSIHVMTRHGDRTPIKFLPLGLETKPWNCLPEHSVVQTDNKDILLEKRSMIYTPEGCLPNGYCFVNPFRPLYWPGNCSAGQLTPKGIQQLNTLGKHIKSIYIDKLKLLSGKFNKDEKDLVLRSTDIWRTHQSANSLLSGMFPNLKNDEQFSIHVMPMPLETTLPLQKSCPLLKKLENEMRNSTMYKEFLRSAEHSRKKLEDIIGGPRMGDNVEDVDYYVDIFQARSCNKFPKVCKRELSKKRRDDNNQIASSSILPGTQTSVSPTEIGISNATLSTEKKKEECITQELIDKMMVYGNAETRIAFRDHPLVFPKLARLRIGGYLLEIKRNILIAVSKHTNTQYIKMDKMETLPNHLYGDNSWLNLDVVPKFLLYSAHDTSLAAVLGALHSDDMNWPPYASNLIFELWAPKKEPNSEDEENEEGVAYKNPEDKILGKYKIRMLYNGLELKTSWCKGSCKVLTFFQYLDDTLGIVGGFEFYGNFRNVATNNSVTSPSTSTIAGMNSNSSSTIINTDGNQLHRKAVLSVKNTKLLPTWDFLSECWIDSN